VSGRPYRGKKTNISSSRAGGLCLWGLFGRKDTILKKGAYVKLEAGA